MIKQKQELIKKLKEFSALSYEIYWLWLEFEDPMDKELGVKKYPFTACLGDVAGDVQNWTESFISELEELSEADLENY